MARIRSHWRGGVLRVTVSGRLRITDVRRFEHACGPALTSHPAALELDLRRVTHADAASTAVLRRIAERAARVTEPPAAEPGGVGPSRRGGHRP